MQALRARQSMPSEAAGKAAGDPALADRATRRLTEDECDAAPSQHHLCHQRGRLAAQGWRQYRRRGGWRGARSEEHTSELQYLMCISYAVFCLTKKKNREQPYTSRELHRPIPNPDKYLTQLA